MCFDKVRRLTFNIYGGLVDGERIELKGKPFADPKRFFLNLRQYLPNDENITFHLEVRFDYLGEKNVIVCNDKVNGVWGPEVRPISPFTFSSSKSYVIAITKKGNNYSVEVDGEHLINFPQGPGSSTPEWLIVYEDTIITSLKVDTND